MKSLVLPAYNPGPAVEQTWRALRRFLQSRVDAWEILIVLDGCTDDSAARLHQLNRDDNEPRIRLINYKPNRGKGYAVRTGLLAARGRLRIFTDIDLAYGFDDIQRIVDTLERGAKVAIASRTHPESELQLLAALLGYAYRRRLQSYAFSRLTRWILPITHTDTQAGLKGMTAEVANHLVPNLTCNGFGFDCEFLTLCRLAGVPVTEVPVRVRYDAAASTTNFAARKMLRELIAIRKQWHGRTLPPTPEPAVEPLHEPLRKAA